MRTPLFASLVTVGLFACGGGADTAPPPAAPSTAADGGASAKAGAPAPTSSYAVSLPPARTVPPLTLGSKIAHVRGRTNPDALGDPPPPACANVPVGAPDATAAALAKACAPGAKPAAAQTVNVTEKDPGASIALAATRACYRVHAAAAPGVEGFVVDVLDSRGVLAVEGRTAARTLVAPAEGPLCFDADDAAKVVVSAGRGGGAISVQITRE